MSPSAAAELRPPEPAARVPGWWPEDGTTFDATFVNGAGRTFVWYRERDGLLLYREVTF